MMLFNCVSAVSVDCPNMINLGKGFNMSPAQMTPLKTNCCTSSGITCDGNSRVTSINWYGFSLTGSINGSAIPSTVTWIDFGANNIGGIIPSILPPGLTSLSLYWNVYLAGPLPRVLPSSIQWLDVSWNAINGTIPTVIPSTLTNLYLHQNQMTGSIPQFPANMQGLWMNANYFYGDISSLPPTITSLILGAAIGDNMANTQIQFYGTLTLNKPSTVKINLNYITNVKILDTSLLTTCEISQNPLSGSPNLASLTMCAQVALYFPVLVDCPNMINLGKGLNMSPAQMAPLQTNCCTSSGVTCDGNSRVTGINWYGFSLSGSINGSAIPASVTSINLGANQIKGRIPVKLPIGLTYLSLYWNSMTGPLPSALPTQIQSLDVSWNYINGTIPTVIPNSLSNFIAHKNQMTGSIPFFPRNMQALWLNGNYFYGDISTLPSSLTSLSLGYTAGDNMANSQPQFTGNLTLRKPSYVRINLNYITNVQILDTSALTTCELSENPLLGNPNLVPLSMCAQIGLYRADQLPYTGTLTTAVKTSAIVQTLTTAGKTSTIVQTLTTAVKTSAIVQSTTINIDLTSDITSTETLQATLPSSIHRYSYISESQKTSNFTLSTTTPSVNFEETTYFGDHPFTFLTISTWFGTLKIVIDIILLYAIISRLYRRWIKKSRRFMSKSSSNNSKQNTSRNSGF